MKFLVVLIAIVVASIWKQDVDRIDDSWFFKMRSKFEYILRYQQAEAGSGWYFVFLVTYSIPLTLLALLLWLSAGLLFGFVALLIHLFILLMAFDRIHPGALARQFQQYWDDSDFEACYLYLEKELRCTEQLDLDDMEALYSTFKRLYAYRCFERMFVTLFWYLVAGPLGVLFAYISYQLRYNVLAGSTSPEGDPVDGIIHVLEWLPLRLLGLTLGLAGNFENCFNRFRRIGFTREINVDQAVYEYTICALGQSDQPGDSQTQESPTAVEQLSAAEYQSRVTGEIAALQRLMQRSQFVWLTVFALFTVFGWQF